MSAVGNAQKFLGGLGTGKFTNGYEEGLVPLMTAVNKASVVGNMDTVKLARDLVTLVNEIFFEAAARVLPIAAHLKEAELHEAACSDAREEIERVLTTMRTLSAAEKTDKGQWELLAQASQHAQETLQAARKAEQLARQEALTAKLAYAEFVIEQGRRIALQVGPLTEQIRGELGVTTDAAAFQAQTIEMQAAAEAAMAKFKAAVVSFG